MSANWAYTFSFDDMDGRLERIVDAAINRIDVEDPGANLALAERLQKSKRISFKLERYDQDCPGRWETVQV